MTAFERQYPSTIDAGNLALDDLLDWLEEQRIEGAPARAISLAVSEAITNAVVHGNGQNPAKIVGLHLGINDCRVRADILDQGQGGIERIESRKPSGDLDEGGRGIDLINVYADSCSFTELESGGLQVTLEFEVEKNDVSIKRVPKEESMEIQKREQDSVVILSLTGRLDLASGASLKDQVKRLVEKENTQIHLNLAEVEFINSSGLGALVSIMKEIRLLKGRLTLSNLASYVQEIFEITQLSHIFEIYGTEEEALATRQAVPTA